MAENPKSQTKKKCRFYWTEEGCRYEDLCKFDHTGIPNISVKKEKKMKEVGLRTLEPKFYPVCIYWEKGECDNGNECKFRHSTNIKDGPAYMVNAQCHRCGGMGHMARECTQLCAKCLSMNHLGYKCTECHYCKEWGHHYKKCPNYCAECKATTHNRGNCPYMAKRRNKMFWG